MSNEFTPKSGDGSLPRVLAKTSPLLSTVHRGIGWGSTVAGVICLGIALTVGADWKPWAWCFAFVSAIWALLGFGIARVIDDIGEVADSTRQERINEIVGVLRRMEASVDRNPRR